MISKHERNKNIGAAILFLIFSLLFFVLISRFIYIQITGEIEGQVLAAKAEQRYLKERPIEAARGSILDRNGEVIAEDTISFKLVAVLDENLTTNDKNPHHVVNPEETAKVLANYLEMEQHEIYEILTKEGRKQVEFGKAGRDISNSLKAAIEEENLPGITFIRDSKRFYPNGIFASHLVGYAEYEEGENGENKVVGKLGLEKSLQTLLEGKSGHLTYKSDSYGFLLPHSSPEITPAENGKDIYLTIDKKIQTFLEESLDNAAEKFSPEKLMAIVANPKTGEILAMAQRPTFHPKTKVGLEQTWHNEVIETSFEPGSTMKVFTLAAAMNDGVFNPTETYKSGSYQVGPDTIRDHNRVGWGEISFLEGVQRSSNVAFSKLVMDKIGADRFHDYLVEFGFNKPTGIDLPNEVSGKILYNYPIEKVTTSYGQGTTLTPMQQVQAMTAIANEGKMMKPQIIKKVVDRETNTIIEKTEPEVVGTPITAESARQVLDVLETVVTSPVGTGRGYAIEGYQIAGKTGTAQIPGPDGKYLTGQENYIFSFLGTAPKDDPELIIYIAVQQPKLDGQRGSDVISSIFKTVMQHSLQYLNIKPEGIVRKDASIVPKLVDLHFNEAKELLASPNYDVIKIGDGTKVVEQIPPQGTNLLEGEKVILKTEGEMTVPDLTGWSLRDVLKVVKLTNLQFSSTGTGYVTKQSLPPGSAIVEEDYLVVELETPLQTYQKRESGDEQQAEKD